MTRVNSQDGQNEGQTAQSSQPCEHRLPTELSGFTEDFSAGKREALPPGWTVENTGNTAALRPGYRGWSVHTLEQIRKDFGATYSRHETFTKANGEVAMVQSDESLSDEDGAARFSSVLWSPPFPLSQDLGAVCLEFDSQYRPGPPPQAAQLVARFDEGAAVVLQVFEDHRLNERVHITFDVPADAHTVKVGWEDCNLSAAGYWMIDNVSLNATAPVAAVPYVEGKQVAVAGRTNHITVRGLRPGSAPTLTFGGVEVAVGAADQNGDVGVTVPVSAAQAPGVVPLTVDGDRVEKTEIPVSVLYPDTQRYVSTEPRLWLSTLDDLEGWTTDGALPWRTLTVKEIGESYGLDGRQAFTRGAGRYAHVGGGPGEAVLTSPKIPLKNLADQKLEFRADTHLRVRGSQTATIKAVFDGPADADQHVLWRSDRDVLSSQLRLGFTVPMGTSAVQFRAEYASGEGCGSWSIDNVYLTRPLPPLPLNVKPEAAIDVFSDIQGDTTRMCENVMAGFEELAETTGVRSEVLVVNGDLVARANAGLYDTYSKAFHACGADRYQTVVSVIGNHEYYGDTFDAEQKKNMFLDYTDMRNVGGEGGLWGEVVVDGKLPVLWVGSETYDYRSKTGAGPFVEFSDRQFEWLRDRLEYYGKRNEPVVLFSHYVFPYSVSGTYIRFTRDDFGDETDRVFTLLQQHPNVTVITSHTHWDIELNDWAVEKRFNPSSEYGLNIFNSGAVTSQYGPNGEWKEKEIEGVDPTGLRVSLYEDRLRIIAYRFDADGKSRIIQQQDVPVPSKH